jgi:RNA polymerase sigma-70 factor (ECF subfamily)
VCVTHREQNVESDESDGVTLCAGWIRDHGDVLYAYALQRVKRAETAEDLVQETLVAAIESWGSFRGGSSVRTWLVGILRYKILDEFRRRARQPGWLEDVTPETGGTTPGFTRAGYWEQRPAAWPENPVSPDEAEELRSLVWSCLSTMPEPMRLAFTMREVDGMESALVCEVLGITPTNLWTLVHRAKLRLREHIGRHWYGEGPGKGA